MSSIALFTIIHTNTNMVSRFPDCITIRGFYRITTIYIGVPQEFVALFEREFQLAIIYN